MGWSRDCNGLAIDWLEESRLRVGLECRDCDGLELRLRLADLECRAGWLCGG